MEIVGTTTLSAALAEATRARRIAAPAHANIKRLDPPITTRLIPASCLGEGATYRRTASSE
jgi:hypothetical protein